MSGGALAGVRVIDVTQAVAGPYCTKLLAGLGAEVIKVERRGHKPERSGLYIHLNTGKKGIALDLAEPAFKEIVKSADVLVESFAAGTMERIGLGFPQLQAVNPGLVMTSISNCGQTGPYRDYQATEIVFMALGGFMFLTGDPDREPVKLAGLQAQYQAGLQAALGTLAALRRRDAMGQAQFVDVSILEAVASLAAQNGVLAANARHEVPQRAGNRLIGNVPTANYPSTTLPCKDGYAHAHGKGWDFEALSVLTGQPRLADEEVRLAQRGHADEIDSLLLPWLMARTKMEVLRDAQEQFVPFEPVLNIDEVLADPQHEARGYFVEVVDPVRGPVKVPGAPVRLSETPMVTGDPGEAALPPFEMLRSAQHDRLARGGLPLEGVRVLDLTQVIAGPYATQVLADLGAEVIKVESHTRYDQTRGRAWLASEPGARGYNRAANFNTLNRNKLGLCLNLNTPGGKEIFRELVKISDVVIENFSPRVMRNFGLSYEALKELNPGIIMASMPGFGSDGPYQNYVSLGPGIDAMSGLQSITGYPDGPPLKSGGGYTDQTTGLNAAVSVLAALQWRACSGRGQRVEVAMREAITEMIGEYFVEYSLTGKLPVRWGNRSPIYAPQGCYRCAGEDSWVAVSIRTEEEWRRLCDVTGLANGPSQIASSPAQPPLGPPLLAMTIHDRRRHHDELDRLIEGWTGKRTHIQAMEELQAAGLAAGAVLNPLEAAADPHLTERGYFETGMHPEGGETLYAHHGFKLEGVTSNVRWPAPCFGQHTRPVLEGLLGLSSAELAKLYDDGVIADQPVS